MAKALWVWHCIVLVAHTLIAICYIWYTMQTESYWFVVLAYSLRVFFPPIHILHLQDACHQWTCDMKNPRGSWTCSSYSRHQERVLGPGSGSIVHQQVVRVQKGGCEWNLRGLLWVGYFFVCSRMNLKFKHVEICWRCPSSRSSQYNHIL